MAQTKADFGIDPYPMVVRAAVADGRHHRLDRAAEVGAAITEHARYTAHGESPTALLACPIGIDIDTETEPKKPRVWTPLHSSNELVNTEDVVDILNNHFEQTAFIPSSVTS
jgi:hypothetical protein